jgi:hypothetical protein
MIVITAIGVLYILAYAWAQLEILSYFYQLWHEKKRGKTLAMASVWLALNVFALFVAPDIHFGILRDKSLNLLGLSAVWAKAVAILAIAAYWIWIAGSFTYAVNRWRNLHRTEGEPK